MATPDSVTQNFHNPQVTVEVAGDYVHMTLVSRFGEPILMLRMSADEADAVAEQLVDAVAVIDTRNAPPPPDGYREVDVTAEGYRPDDSVDPATGRTYRKVETPNPTFSEAVDDLFAHAAVQMARS